MGYIGTVMVPMLLKAGHEVIGLDSDLYEKCTFAAGGNIARCRISARMCATPTAGDLEGFDAVIHLAALSNDPLGNLNPDITYAHQSSRQRASGQAREGCRGQALSACLVVQQLRLGGR